MIVYLITNKLNGKRYVGKTVGILSRRWYYHYSESSHCIALKNAIKLYGKENFHIEEVAKYNNLEDLNNAEEYYIDFYNCLSPNGYNLKLGGNAPRHNEVTKQRMSVTRQKMVAEGRMPWLPKKGERRSPITEFKKGDHKGKEIKSGEHLSPSTQFKKGNVAPNKGRKRIIDETGKVRYIKVAV